MGYELAFVWGFLHGLPPSILASTRPGPQQFFEWIDFQEEGGLSMHCAYRRLNPTGMLPSSAKLPNTPRAEVNPGKHSQEVVYLVDDDYLVRETLRDFLEECGFQVWTFSSARNTWNLRGQT